MTITITKGGDWRAAAAAEYAERRAALARKRDKALKGAANLQKKAAEADEEISDLDRGAKAFGLPLADDATLHAANVSRAAGNAGAHDSRQFKDVALEYLATAYPASLKAVDVQDLVQAALGRSFHWKTAGMTLYRLKNEHKVQRSGQNWTFVPEDQRAALKAAEEAAQRERPRQEPLTLEPRPNTSNLHDDAYWAAKRAELAYDEGEQGPEFDPNDIEFDEDGEVA